MSLFTEKLKLDIEETELKAETALNSWPPVLKWVFVLAIVLILPVYFTARAISEKVWENKLAVFSASAKPSFSSSKEVQPAKAEIAILAPGVYSAYGVLENPNFDLSAKSAQYEFVFFGALGERLTPVSGDFAGETFFLPAEKKFLAASKVFLPGPAVRAELQLKTAPKWQKKNTIPKADMSVSGVSFKQQDSPFAFAVFGKVKNQSPYLVKRVKISFYVYGAGGKFLTASLRQEYDLKSFEERVFTQLWPNINFSEAVAVEVKAETDVFAPGNLIFEADSTGEASDLSRPEENFR